MNAPDRLPARKKLLFSIGDLSTGMPLTVLMFFQLFFLTDVAGLRPDLAGWSIMAGRIWDAVNDPLLGILSDRIRSRLGRRRVVLLFGSVPLGLAFMLMWLIPPFGQLGLTIYYALAFILFDTAFTFIHVSYNSLTPEMTQDYDERSSLNGYRMVIQIAGTIGALIIITVLGWYYTDKRSMFMLIGVSLGLLTILPPLIVFRVTREKPPEQLPAPMPFRDAIRHTLNTRPFWMVMGLFLFSWTTASILSAILVYFANYYLRVPYQANYLVLLAQVSAIAFVPVMVWIAQKLDKRRSFILGMLSWMVVLAGIALIRPEQVWLAYLFAALSGMGIATAYVIPWAMIPDVVEYDELRTGQRREGSFYAFTSFFQKLGTGLALWLMGQILAATGYITPPASGPLPVQPEAAVNAIRVMMGAAPAILLIPAILLAWMYPITREKHRALREELAARPE